MHKAAVWVVRVMGRVMVRVIVCVTGSVTVLNVSERGAMETLVFQKRVLNLGLDIDSTLAGGFRF